MPRIDFAFGAPDRLRTACLVARKQYQAGRPLVVYCGDAKRLQAFDRLLWAFDDTTFIPHVRADDPLAVQTPVLLAATAPARARDTLLADAQAGQPAPWLLNLDDDCPPDYDAFERVLEIVSADDEADRHAARARWRSYQGAGHTPQSHAIGNAAPAGETP